MEEIKVKGIVLKSIDYKDSDKIVTIFSTELGLINARVRGVKKNTAKLTFAVQPFAFVEFLLIKSGNFYTCINATSIDQFFGITADFDNYIFMLACNEICLKTIREGDLQPELFLLLLNSLKYVCYENFNPMCVFIKFMLEALKILGYLVQVSKCACCGRPLSNVRAFSFEFNGMICSNCQSNNNLFLELSEGEYAILKNIDMTPLNRLSSLKFLSRENIVSIINLLTKDFRVLFDSDIDTLKSFL